MGRKPRIWVKEAYHHIYSRGNNRQNIFCDEEDVEQVFRIWTKIHMKYPIEIAAYCIMTNHYHFLLKTEYAPLSLVVGMFNKSYSNYYNPKYSHSGHVFQNRFGSAPVLSQAKSLETSKYIHRNPINTEIPLVNKMEDYPYSSYQFYKNGTPPPYPFINLTDIPQCFELYSLNNTITYCQYVEDDEIWKR